LSPGGESNSSLHPIRAPAYYIFPLTSNWLPALCVQLIQLRLSLSQLGVNCSGKKVVRLFSISAVAAEKWYDFLKSGTTFSRISCSRRRLQLSRCWIQLSRRQISCCRRRDGPPRAHVRPCAARRNWFSKNNLHLHHGRCSRCKQRHFTHQHPQQAFTNLSPILHPLLCRHALVKVR